MEEFEEVGNVSTKDSFHRVVVLSKRNSSSVLTLSGQPPLVSDTHNHRGSGIYSNFTLSTQIYANPFRTLDVNEM